MFFVSVHYPSQNLFASCAFFEAINAIGWMPWFIGGEWTCDCVVILILDDAAVLVTFGAIPCWGYDWGSVCRRKPLAGSLQFLDPNETGNWRDVQADQLHWWRRVSGVNPGGWGGWGVEGVVTPRFRSEGEEWGRQRNGRTPQVSKQIDVTAASLQIAVERVISPFSFLYLNSALFPSLPG